jgi:SAM-dependent methyltransferase
MTDPVRDAYDARAAEYAACFLRDLDRDPYARDRLAAFATLAASSDGVIADVGCGPGHVVAHLSALGVTTVGYDLSPGQIDEARRAFPDAQFHVGDLAALDSADCSLGGIVSRHSLIHMLPSRLDDVFAEWMRVLEPGAPVLVSFFGSLTSEAHGTPFDHTVMTAYELFPATVARRMQDAGFTDIEIGVLDPPEGGRLFSQATVLARKPDIGMPS